MNTISIRPRTLDFVSFANWAIKNIPGEYSIFLGHNNKGVCDCIEIGDIKLFADAFICATINENTRGQKELELEYYKVGSSASRTYTKRVIKENPDCPYKMFTPCKSILDPIPENY